MRFEIYHEGEPWDGTKGYRWRLIARNGKIAADSGEAYSSIGNCRKAINRIVDYIRTDPQLQVQIVVLPDA